MAVKLPDGFWGGERGSEILRAVADDRASRSPLAWHLLAEKLGREYGLALNGESLRGAWKSHKPMVKGAVTFEDIKRPESCDVAKFVSAMKQLQSEIKALDTKQVKGTVTLNTDKPIGIAFWGDWHIGGVGVDYELFEEHLELIKNTDGLYIIGMGDMKDNLLPTVHASSTFEQVIQPGYQDIAVKHYIEQVADKVLCLVRGCHDDWDKRQDDKDFISTLVEICEPALNFWHGGTLTLNVGKQTYTGHVRHKYKYESSLNTMNAQRRMFEMFGPADFAALAHLHNPEIDTRHIMGDFRWMIRSGSYKEWDEFGQKIGGYKGKVGVPVLILYPNEHLIVGERDLRKAVDILNHERASA